MHKPTIYIGADHRGWKLKEAIEIWLHDNGYTVVDMGNENLVEHDDYPDFGHAVAKRVVTQPGSRGIVLCGSAAGICIVANKVRGVRAATVFNQDVAAASRQDDDANILCLPADHVNKREAVAMVKTWLETPFSNAARHQLRLKKVEEIERQEFGE
mgnify:CR=1 FL=1